MRTIKKIVSFIFLVVSSSCIDPYIPVLNNYSSLLVVEGLITNENISHKIKLGRTTKQEDSKPEMVNDANVSIIDGNGTKTALQNCGNGYYKTDSTSFTGVIGQRYTLQILTSDGQEYKSEESVMLPVAAIDKIYYEKGEEISEILGELFTGLKIFVNSSDAEESNRYFRWTFEEDWKIRMPNPQIYTYARVNDSTINFAYVPVIKSFCWKRHNSGEIITGSILPGEGNNIRKKEIHFIAPVKTDRLTIQYSIVVKQFSISEKEYNFWNNLKKAGEAGGDIFASQPFPVISNIHNVNNKEEQVLGFFEVSSVTRKRIFVTSHELEALNLPHYRSDCDELPKSPDDFGPANFTWDDVYRMYTDKGKFVFIRPEVTPNTLVAGHVYVRNLLELVFAPTDCVVCETSGLLTKPVFWVDLE
jgi:hypothetical protein